jgi:2-polyprenyl-3-methyl-5-hydroxy-6-metoxy-1,4-benzoquinol methylase
MPTGHTDFEAMEPMRDEPVMRRAVRRSGRWSRMMYLLDSLSRYATERSCPNCGGHATRQLQRKYVVTRLLRCPDCHLQFRHPKATAAGSLGFYQDAYAQEDGITTDLPDESGLQRLRAEGFGEKNVDIYAGLFGRMYPGRTRSEVRVIDYGCSWGYQALQLREHGYDISGLEVSRNRAAFGRERLRLDIVTTDAELRPGADIFFSSHVIEHLPDPGQLLRTGLGLLREGGYFVAECPNGSPERRRCAPGLTRKAWGMVHPNLICADFLSHAFRHHPFLILSAPSPTLTDRFMDWDGRSQQVYDLSGPNLLIIAKKSRTSASQPFSNLKSPI